MSGIPFGWVETNIGGVTDYVSRGKSPRYAESSPLPVVNQRAIRWFGIQQEHLKFVHPEQFPQWGEERFIRAGDILWNSTGTGTIGRACLVSLGDLSPPKVVDSHVTIVRPKRDAIDPRYLFAWIRGPEVQHSVEDLATGTTNQIELSRATVVQTRVPLAPVAEQKRIADKLDSLLERVDACRERLDRVPEILKRFRQSVLAAATSGELTREWREVRGKSMKWRRAPLGSLLVDVRYGTAKKCTYAPRATPVLRIPNVVGGLISQDDLKYAEFDEAELAKLALVADDILMIRSNGSVELVGRTALVSEREAGFLFAGYLIRLRADITQASPAYLSMFLGAPTSRARIEGTARSTTGVNNINAEEIRAIPIDVPSLEEQEQIVERVGVLLGIATRLEGRLALAKSRAENITPAILAKAFSGRLVPQDPNDEPASDLLARVRGSGEAPATAAEPGQGGPRGRRAQIKGEINMLTRADVAANHLAIILKEHGALAAEALWAHSGLGIDEFYEQLKDEAARGLLRESRDEMRDVSRVLELAA